MVIRHLTPSEFERVHSDLIQHARSEPLSASYLVDFTVNRFEYTLRVQPMEGRRIAALEALQVERDENGPNFLLETSRRLLGPLLELLVYQGTG